MAEMYRQGVTLVQIGEKFGMTRERVRQILRAIDVYKTDGGAAVRRAAKQAAKRRAKDVAYLSRHGVDYATYRHLVAIGATRPFQQQRSNARARGIDWKLTLGDWWSIWERSGKWEGRGRTELDYVMSRINDAGPYALGNVHIQTCQENSRDAVKKWHGKDKQFRGVFDLYPGRPEKRFLARIGKFTVGYFPTAEAAALARLSVQLNREVEGCV
jgi:hypothetical protein